MSTGVDHTLLTIIVVIKNILKYDNKVVGPCGSKIEYIVNFMRNGYEN
jgi:hypothetical protein